VFSVHGSRLPAPLIVPGAVVEVQERVDSSGKVVAELDVAAAVERLTRMIEEYELDSVAIALLWSFANPAHENALAAAIPRVFVSCSSEVSPRLGEYERTVATVLNGYVGPASSRYLSELQGRLTTPLLIMQSSGGVLPASTATPAGHRQLRTGRRADRRRHPRPRLRPRPRGRNRHGWHVVRPRPGD
jgi:N-methylhydantoinase A